MILLYDTVIAVDNVRLKILLYCASDLSVVLYVWLESWPWDWIITVGMGHYATMVYGSKARKREMYNPKGKTHANTRKDKTV